MVCGSGKRASAHLPGIPCSYGVLARLHGIAVTVEAEAFTIDGLRAAIPRAEGVQ